VNGKPAETLVTGERRLAIRGRFEMVAADGCRRPTAIAEARDTAS
jgi:acyl-CoA hydrolase